ncbi:MAG: gamma-glutamyl-gamma-aminobutyrate hydrolase family protein [Chloroflexota bacterium]
MTKSPLIGITTYHRNEKGYIQLPGQYADSVRRAGGIPLLIQPGEPRLDELMTLLDGLILSGGGDVDPSLYTDEAHEQVYWVDKERDQFEIELTERSLHSDMPLFCICRGLQILNVTLGGTLLTHIPDDVENAIAHRQPPRDPVQHAVDIDPHSQLATMMQSTQVKTASWHHQSIGELAPGLRAVGSASDGVIEAVEMTDNPNLLAVQWHPELTAEVDESQHNLFKALVDLAKAK